MQVKVFILVLLVFYYSVFAVSALCGCRAGDFSATCVQTGTCANSACFGAAPASSGTCPSWTAPTACPVGSYNYGAGTNCSNVAACSLGSCLPCNCGLGQTITTCDSLYTDFSVSKQKNLVCSQCTTAPQNSEYTTRNTCDFICSSGYAYVPKTRTCAWCPVVCSPGYQLSGHCTQSTNGGLAARRRLKATPDQTTTCSPCVLDGVDTYSTGCVPSACINSYILDSTKTRCIVAPSPPPPPTAPPSPPNPPNPPNPPPPLAASYSNCANKLTSQWVGSLFGGDGSAPPVFDDVLIDSMHAADATLYNATYQTTGTRGLVLDGGGSATVNNAQYVSTTDEFSMFLRFTPRALTEQVIYSATDNTGANYVRLGFKTPSNTTTFAGGLMTYFLNYKTTQHSRSQTYASTKPVTVGIQNTIQITCGPGLNSCALF